MIIKAAIIGSRGKIGQKRKKILEGDDRVEISALCDISNNSNSPGISANISYYTDYHKLLEREKLDAVFICVPHTLTKEIVLDALSHNIHVFSEKPPGICLKDVDEMKKALISHPGCKLKFGFNHRYYSHIQNAKKIIDSGELGKAQWIKGTYGRVGLGNGWRLTEKDGGHGILLSQGIHLVDLFRFLTGQEFTEIKSFVSHFDKKWYEDNVFAIMRSSDGIVGSLHSSCTLRKNAFIIYIGLEHGYIRIENLITSTRSFGFPEELCVAYSDKTFFYGNPQKTSTFYGIDNSWKSETDEFIDVIINKKPVRNGSIDDAYENMKIVEEVYKNGRK